MSVSLQYTDEYGIIHNLSMDSEGFWQSTEDVEPSQFTATFTATDISDSSLLFEQSAKNGWFQLDSVFLGAKTVGDSYFLNVSDDDVEISGNPQLYEEISVFPNNLNDILVPINEYLTHTSMNSVLGKINDNFQFLLDKARYLSIPPNYISFRYGPSNYEFYKDLGNVWQQLDNGISSYWAYDTELSASNVAGNSDCMVYSTGGVSVISGAYEISGISATSGIFLLQDLSATSGLGITIIDEISAISASYSVYYESSSGVPVITGDKLIAIPTISAVDPIEFDRDYYIYGDDKFHHIISIESDKNGYIWMLDDRVDGGKVGIFNFYNNIWRYVSSWSSSIIENSKYFSNPTDLKIKGNRVYISCDRISGGQECRIFDLGGSYIGSASYGELSEIESLAITNKYIIALSKNNLYKFDSETFEFTDKINLSEQIFDYDPYGENYKESTIKRLANNSNSIFFYGISNNLIYKFGQSGSVLESFGETVINHMNSTLSGESSYLKPLSDIYHDSDFNLYASSSYDIVKYYDRARIYNRLLEDLSFNIDDYIWELEEIDVDKNENATAWIYNKIFDRILDNLNLFRIALKGSLALVSSSTFEKVVVNNFTKSQFEEFPYSKGDIHIGVNELHCEGALNRCLRQLNECFEVCLRLLNIRAKGIDPDSLIIDSFELVDQIDHLPEAEYIAGVYHFDYLRDVTNFSFEWNDRIVYRSDPRLRAYISLDGANEVVLPKSPTPNSYLDTNILNSGTHVWTLRETFGEIEKTANLTILWNKRIYYGVYEDGSSITIDDILSGSESIQGGSIIENEADTDIIIQVPSEKRFYIAIPYQEYDISLSADSRNVKLYHPDYSEMLYDYNIGDGWSSTINSFITDYGNNGKYFIITPPNWGNIYNDGITEIKFRLTRGI